MSNIWQLRLAHSKDWPALSSVLAAADLDLIDATDGNSDEQLLLALGINSIGQEQALLGCIRIRRNIGLSEPRYWYHLGTVVHAAPDLGVFHRQRTLLIGNDHTGAIELSDLAIESRYLDPTAAAELTRCLVHSALRLILQPADEAASSTQIIAALPGIRNAQGESPFWQGLGRHFYSGDVDEAASRFGSAWITHAAALLPRHPLVSSLLHPDAQAAMGCTSEESTPLRRALTEAGMRAGQHLSLFDAGPIFEGLQSDLASAKQWRSVTIRAINTPAVDQTENSDAGATRGLLTAAISGQFWCIPLTQDLDTVSISNSTAKTLGAKSGDRMWLWSAP